MDSQILEELIRIKWISLATFVALLLSIIYVAVITALRVKGANTKSLLMLRDEYATELSLLEIKGDYGVMLEKAEEMVQAFPNDLLANWYLAVSQDRTKQYGAALSSLGRIKEINPSWSADLVDDLISQVKGKMDGPRASDV